MDYIFAEISKRENFFGKTDPFSLVKKYGSPLYVYNEKILRTRCREMKSLLKYPNFIVNYSAKANTNLTFLKIVKNEGLHVDAMSPGEIFVEQKAGFKPEDILYISNNVSAEEMQYAIDKKIDISVDSLSQLDLYGQLNPGGRAVIRFNPGVGAGHHTKVVTGGKKTKFGVDPVFMDDIKATLQKHRLTLVGINQHIGSLFMEGQPYIEGVKSILSIAESFKDLEFIDMGGGFGIPYKKQEGQPRLDLKELGSALDKLISQWVQKYGKQLIFKIEPGRYISAECGILLGTVNTVKLNFGQKYIGTDLGFNVLKRPVMYDSHHEIEIYRSSGKKSTKKELISIVGNICETGDIIAKNRELPEIFESDVLGVLDSGAYGFSMCSNYNQRLRPAEVFITENGLDQLSRKRDSLEDLTRNYI